MFLIEMKQTSQELTSSCGSGTELVRKELTSSCGSGTELVRKMTGTELVRKMTVCYALLYLVNHQPKEHPRPRSLLPLPSPTPPSLSPPPFPPSPIFAKQKENKARLQLKVLYLQEQNMLMSIFFGYKSCFQVSYK